MLPRIAAGKLLTLGRDTTGSETPVGRCRGDSFLIELRYRTYRRGFRLAEVPIIFTDRKFGQSKIIRHEVLRSVWAV